MSQFNDPEEAVHSSDTIETASQFNVERFSLALAAAERESQEAASLLRLFAYFAPNEEIPLELIAHQSAGAWLPGPLKRALRNSGGKPVATLVHHGLIEKSPDEGPRVHPEVQSMTRARLDLESEKKWAGRAINVIGKALPDMDHESVEFYYLLLMRHLWQVSEHAERLEVELRNVAAHLVNVAVIMFHWGNFQVSYDFDERALKLMRRLPATKDNEVYIAMVLENLAANRFSQEEYESAQALVEEALEIRQRVAPADDPSIADAERKLRLVISKQGKTEGSTLFPQATISANDPGNIANLLALGEFHEKNRNFENALDLYQQAVSLEVRTLKEYREIDAKRARGNASAEERNRVRNHVHIGHAVHALERLGMGFEIMGDLEHARKAAEVVLDARRQMLTADDPSISGSLLQLGDVLAQQGDFERARELLEEALRIAVKSNSDPFFIGVIRSRLGRAYRGLNKLDLAREQFERALTNSRRAGDAQTSIFSNLMDLGGILLKQGDIKLANARLEEVLRMYRSPSFKADESDLARFNELAALLQQWGVEDLGREFEIAAQKIEAQLVKQTSWPSSS